MAAQRPKSMVSADTDVNLDFLTKEEKEALLSKKMDMIRQRNKALTERHKLIEADKKQAEDAGRAVKPSIDSQSLPAEGAPKPRGRGRGQPNQKDSNKPGKERPKSHGDFRDTSNYEPIVDTSDLASYRHDFKGRGRSGGGGGQHRNDFDSRDGHPHPKTPQNKRKGPPKEELPVYPTLAFEYEPIVDLTDLDKRFGHLSDQNGNFGEAPHPSSLPQRQPQQPVRSPSPTKHVSFDNEHLDPREPDNAQSNNGFQHSNSNRRSGRFRQDRNFDKSQHSNQGGRYSGEGPRDGRSGEGLREHQHENDSRNQPAYKGRLKDADGPPPDPSFNPLADRRRSDRPDSRKEEGNFEYRRHPRNYGGGAELNKVKQNMKTQREKEKERPQGKKPLEISMTGKERRNHEEWKAERDRYDNERIQRQMDDKGTWRRAWDVDKAPDEFDDSAYHSGRMEPAKRPAGRIGSGRFDRGDRDERPRSGGVPTKGGPPQPSQHQEHSSPPKRPQQSHQSPEKSLHSEHAQTSQAPAHQPQGVREGGRGGGPRGGRGRGRGRGRGSGSGGQVAGAAAYSGERAPRPRTWSGGDDRSVECQKQQLLVKFDNTAGDNSVEVEYDDIDVALSPPTTPNSGSQRSMTTPRHGPTGRTPNQTGQKSSRRSGDGSGKSQGKNASSRSNRGRGGSRPSSTHNDDDWDADPLQGGRVRSTTSSSHSHSYGDSEEWEDCTTSEDDPNNVNSDLHLECKLNPDAPEFLPTSPDVLKTPPGHVKVLNWSANAKPPSSQGSATSPRILSQNSNPPASPTPAAHTSKPSNQNTSPRSPSPHSSISSPGSSASVRARNRREELDQMPEADQPFDPSELFGGGLSSGPPMTQPSALQAEEDEDDDNFEDSVEESENHKNVSSIETGNETKMTDSVESPSNPSEETVVEEDNDRPDPVLEHLDDATADAAVENTADAADEGDVPDISATIAGQSQCLDLAAELAHALQNESHKDSKENPITPHADTQVVSEEDVESQPDLSEELVSSNEPPSEHKAPSDQENNNVDDSKDRTEEKAAEKTVGEENSSPPTTTLLEEEGKGEMKNEPTAEISTSS